MLDKLVTGGYLEIKENRHFITEKGKDAGGEFRMSKRFGMNFYNL
ncbi:hypothetical protein [Gallaecimonas mangrovi]|nr:hypothetical protein [Gallaecimonas mangrovi]